MSQSVQQDGSSIRFSSVGFRTSEMNGLVGTDPTYGWFHVGPHLNEWAWLELTPHMDGLM